MPHRSLLLPILLTALAIGLLSLMDAFMKGASLAVGAFSAAWLRSTIGTGLVAPYWLATRKAWPSREALRIHLLRGTVGTFMTVTFFFALTRLRLAEAISIAFIAPLLALYLAAILLGERIGRRAIGGSLLGVVGTLVIIGGRLSNEAMATENWLGLASLLVSAALYAWNLILQRQQALLADPAEVASFHSGVVMILLGFAAPWFFTIPDGEALRGIAIAAVLTVLALLLMAWAYARAEAQVLVPIEYTGFVWAALFGWLFFAEHVTAPMVAGAGLIIFGCWIAAPRGEGHASEQTTL